jgi:hypothetical protein
MLLSWKKSWKIGDCFQFNQESSSQLALGATFGLEPPAQEVRKLFICAPEKIS